jgi:hypothetical protein
MAVIALASFIVLADEAGPFQCAEIEPVFEKVETTGNRLGQPPDNDLNNRAISRYLSMPNDQFRFRHYHLLWLFLP